MMRTILLLIIAVASLTLAGCGTNLPVLLEEDGKIPWTAYAFNFVEDDTDSNYEDRLLNAARHKDEACEEVYSRVSKRLSREMSEGPPGFFLRLRYDLDILTAFLFPIGFVEDCRKAVRQFHKEYEAHRDG